MLPAIMRMRVYILSTAKALDQFFTKRSVADECVTTLQQYLAPLGYVEQPVFLEPSAGSGNFLDAATDAGFATLGYDIDPQRGDIRYADFLATDLQDDLPSKDDCIVVIGNPPFGKRSKLAIDFINHGFTYSDTVAFVLPIQFNKFLTQRKIHPDAALVHTEILEPDSFTFKDKSYAVRSVFQIWTLRDITGTALQNHRILTAPPTKHEDFDMLLYNCTPEALYMFNEDWDFAVLRQGWADMHPIENTPEVTLDRRKQWMFFRSDSPEVLAQLRAIDFNKLGEKNTSVRGFGKADVVEEYLRLYS